ncbi:related to Phosducin [Ustilago sp. UG-2017b]|nr:related to Phosducin [Ustilago sp. UG-2017b]
MSGSGDPMEAAILQGIDAHPTSSYREDRRAAQDSDADDAPNTDDELGSDLPDDEHDLYHNDDDDGQHQHASSSAAAAGGSEREGGIKGLMSSRTAKRGGEGASKTGPKGVLRDQQLRAQQESAARSAAVHATNRRMEGLALSSETYTQQAEREKREQAARLRRENADSDDDDVAVSQKAIADLQAKERRREMRIAELKSYNAARNSALVSGNPASAVGATVAPPAAAAGKGASNRWFGHLREVDERGYVSAIDIEHADVPVVIHIYSKAVAQCNVLTASLASLARQYPRTKFLQVQAAAIGFGKSANTDDGEDDEEEYDEYNPKTLEVLPTVLVYKAGTLVANLVRVDLDPMWKHGREQDVRDLLDSYDALAGAVGAAGAAGATAAPASDRNDQGDDDD